MAWQYAILVNVYVNFLCEISDGPKHVSFNIGTMHLINKTPTEINSPSAVAEKEMIRTVGHADVDVNNSRLQSASQPTQIQNCAIILAVPSSNAQNIAKRWSAWATIPDSSTDFAVQSLL